MTISIGAFTTGSLLHGPIKVTPWEFSRSSQTFFGTVGEYNLYGKSHHAYNTAWLLLSGYSTYAALLTFVGTMRSSIGVTGTLTCDLGGGDAPTLTNCIFEGFEPDEDPWKDASGVNGWCQRGTLKFRQRAT